MGPNQRNQRRKLSPELAKDTLSPGSLVGQKRARGVGDAELRPCHPYKCPSPTCPSLLDQGRTCDDIHHSRSGLCLQDQTVRWVLLYQRCPESWGPLSCAPPQVLPSSNHLSSLGLSFPSCKTGSSITPGGPSCHSPLHLMASSFLLLQEDHLWPQRDQCTSQVLSPAAGGRGRAVPGPRPRYGLDWL